MSDDLNLVQAVTETLNAGVFSGKRKEPKLKSKLARFEDVAAEKKEIYIRKQNDYGDSFGKSFEEFGIMSAVVRISDKCNRLISLTGGAKQQVKAESIRDTLLDMSNYCDMTIVEIDENAELSGIQNEDPPKCPYRKTVVDKGCNTCFEHDWYDGHIVCKNGVTEN